MKKKYWVFIPERSLLKPKFLPLRQTSPSRNPIELPFLLQQNQKTLFSPKNHPHPSPCSPPQQVTEISPLSPLQPQLLCSLRPSPQALWAAQEQLTHHPLWLPEKRLLLISPLFPFLSVKLLLVPQKPIWIFNSQSGSDTWLPKSTTPGQKLIAKKCFRYIPIWGVQTCFIWLWCCWSFIHSLRLDFVTIILWY